MEKNNRNRDFKILSIDGGGIRGIIPAKIICEYEQQMKANNPNYTIYEEFDLICGTSTGAILAIGLALGIPALELVNFYKDYAKEIFPKWYFKIIPQGARVLTTSIYSSKTLHQKLKEVFSKANKGTVPLLNDLKTKVCIPSYNGNVGEINVLKTKHHPEYNRDYKLPAHDIALSSASAPVYFPPHSFKFDNKFGTGSNVNMIDGGIFANNPALIGILEAADKLDINFSDIKVISIGTGKGKQIIKKSWTPKNFWYWFVPKPRLLEMILDSQSQITDRYIDFLQRSLSKNCASFKYLRIQHEFGNDTISLNASGKKDIERLENIGGELAKKQMSKIMNFLSNKLEKNGKL